MRSKPAHLLAQFRIAPRLGRLPLQRSQLLFHFHENVVHAREIEFRGFEFRFRQAPLGLVHGDARGFFDDRAPVHRLRVQNLADAALLDDGVAIRAEADAHEKFLNVAQPRHAAIDQIFALPRAVQTPRHHHFAGLQVDGGFCAAALLDALLVQEHRVRSVFCGDRTSPRRDALSRFGSLGCGIGIGIAVSLLNGCILVRPVDHFRHRLGQFRIDQRQRDFRQPHRRALGRAVEDAVGHALGAQHLWLCSPSTQEMASTTFDLPQPLGPTMQVIPLPLNVIGVLSQNDLKPSNSTLRSFSTQPSQDAASRASSAGEASV